MALRVKDLSLEKLDRFGTDLHDVSLELREGEVVGIAGVSGNGQQQLLAAISGEDPRAEEGAIELFGQPIGRLRVGGAAQAGAPLHPRGAARARGGADRSRWPTTCC